MGCRYVALRKESVDRNQAQTAAPAALSPSLSARRAWIEMARLPAVSLARRVALRKESVDRNYSGTGTDALARRSLSARRAWIEITSARCICSPRMSLSARRAWIEILDTLVTTHVNIVALRKESVDRNLSYALELTDERASLSARRAWIEIHVS